MFPAAANVICVIHIVMLVFDRIIIIVAAPEWARLIFATGC